MYLFAAAVIAQRGLETAYVAITLFGYDKAHAIGGAIEWAKTEKYSEDEGWYNHQASVIQVKEDVLLRGLAAFRP